MLTQWIQKIISMLLVMSAILQVIPGKDYEKYIRFFCCLLYTSGNLKELDIVVKDDVQGSVEAIKQSLLKLSNDEVVVKIIHGGVGAINESDVILASASNAIIIGFNVRPDATAKDIAEREGVDLRLYRVIYNAIEDVEAAMKGMLDPVFEEKVLGHAEVRQTFKASGVGTIAGA